MEALDSRREGKMLTDLQSHLCHLAYDVLLSLEIAEFFLKLRSVGFNEQFRDAVLNTAADNECSQSLEGLFRYQACIG